MTQTRTQTRAQEEYGIQQRHGFLPLLVILSTGLAVLAASLYLMIQLGMG